MVTFLGGNIPFACVDYLYFPAAQEGSSSMDHGKDHLA